MKGNTTAKLATPHDSSDSDLCRFVELALPVIEGTGR